MGEQKPIEEIIMDESRLEEKAVEKRLDYYTGDISEHCPRCACFIDRYNSRIPWREVKYCCYCGQAVKWDSE